MQVAPSIFKAYDIRGIVPSTLTPEVARGVGRAFGMAALAAGEKTVAVGRDGRLSGPALAEALMAGLMEVGADVIDIGMAPTPVIYFGAYHLRAGSCVSVTGSHNPPDYDGFKVVVGGETLSGATITDLYHRIVGGRLIKVQG